MSSTAEKYNKAKAENPKLRIRDIAKKIGICEAELVNEQLGGKATALKVVAREILPQIEKLGKVMALTRNESAVIERKGVYKNGKFESSHVGLFVGADIDLRIFLNNWVFAFAVESQTSHGVRKSLQFFDEWGEAVHKIFLLEDSNEDEYKALVEKYKVASTPLKINPESEEQKSYKNDDQVNWQKVEKQWSEMTDTHQFFILLKKNQISRIQAFNNVPKFARKVSNNSIEKTLEAAREQQVPIMIFVGNRGCIEIHTGEIHNLKWFGKWYNILDDELNLHLNMDDVAQTWVVEKPSEAGIVTALEVFDKKGENIATFFGKRKPGIAELESWKNILKSLS